jgi:hypothetical protein
MKMIRRFWLKGTIAISLAFLILLSFVSIKKGHNAVHYETFYTQHGWGYNIITKDKILIHQDVIPVLNEQKGFNSKWQAEKAAMLVIKKIKAKEFPQLTEPEIQLLLSLNETD